MKAIPNSDGFKFTTANGRVEMMRAYGDSAFPYDGVNEDGEQVRVSISKDSMAIATYQNNGWVRVNYYDANGEPEGETFDGRWMQPGKIKDKPVLPEMKRFITKQQVAEIIENLKGNCTDRAYDEALKDVLSEVIALTGVSHVNYDGEDY